MHARDTNSTDTEQATVRRLFMIMSPRSLPYGRLALASLCDKAEEPFTLFLITDSGQDKEVILNEVRGLFENERLGTKKTCSVFDAQDLSEKEALIFGEFGNIKAFRRGHPCWRKITDPILLSELGDEMIVLDPDVLFPNKFCFEHTPQSGLLLMWQRPSCLLPANVVITAMEAGVRLAHHTDIGVAQWRMPVDLEWLDWLLGKLGGPNLPNSMHVESIVWAALAMRLGGGYLDPKAWLCWRRTQRKRIARKLGFSGPGILKREPWGDIKCFHAGGEAKWWLSAANGLGYLNGGKFHESRYEPIEFEELTRAGFNRIERTRRWLDRLGYYQLFNQN
jgi:hypothetical protein